MRDNAELKLERLADDEGERRAMARAACERILCWFTWERNAKQISVAYAWVPGSAGKPDFAMPFP